MRLPRIPLIALTLTLVTGLHARGATYFVSPSGSDDDSGTIAKPFRTIQHAAEVMNPGDTCFVRAGFYRETVRPARSGLKGKPITFAAHRGEAVVVSGADALAGWRRTDGRIYQASTEWTFDQLFVDGRMMNPARWPNSPLDPMRPVWEAAAAGTKPGLIVDPNLPACDLSGATVHILPGRHWVSWTRPVTAHRPAAHSLEFNSDWSQEEFFRVGPRSRYCLFGIAALLDAPGEWHLDSALKAVRLWAPMSDNPNRHRVEVRRRGVVFDLGEREYVQVKGFRIFAGAISLAKASHCLVENCHLRYACHFTNAEGWGGGRWPISGVFISGHDNQLRSSSVIYSAGDGVSLEGGNHVMDNCLVRYADYAAVDYGAVSAEGSGHAITHNTLCYTGRSVLRHLNLKAGRIEHNDLHHAGLMTADLGTTYSWGTDGAGTVIAYNLVHHSTYAGIYLDNGSSNFVVHHNICWNNSGALTLNTPSHDNLIYNNTLADNGRSVGYWGTEGNKDQAGTRFINNICTDEVRTGDGIELSHNFTGKGPGFADPHAADFRLRATSPCVDAGLAIPGAPLRFSGRAPDIGALEYGAPPWTAGHTWGELPVF